ncbi:class I SAM-dependent methyltransferase [Corynebacterium sp. AOP40-9SA-29]|uniref:class I SAM-dependent methyltransferase n=1 Tax=Corynebacterium sp. AOP40-9SA-29 TaxID=3457677 RepID=UPI0040349B08
MSFSLDEVDWLKAHPDAVAGAETLALTKSSRVADTATLRREHGEYSRALMELVSARRSAVAGGKVPGDWLVCGDSAQQATPAVVAAERAEHIAGVLGASGTQDSDGLVVADVTCSVGTELPHLAARFGMVIGGDMDPVRLAMARHNMAVTGQDAGQDVGRVALVRADAVRPVFAPGAVDVVVADPARRTARGRIRDPKDLLPPLPDLLEAHRGAAVAVKCAPGIDYGEWEGQVDVVSVDGGVKEACLYTPSLAVHERRAVVFRDGQRRVLTSDDEESEEVGAVGRYILDPDGAVVRAGLVRQYAAALGWWRVDPHIAYLSGDSLEDLPDKGMAGAFLPGQRVFEVIEQVQLKKLRPALAALGCGRLEILVRGVDVDPDQLRRKMKLKGDRELTVVLTRIGDTSVAVITEELHLRG